MKEYKRLTKYSEENQDYITPYCDTQNCNGVCLYCDYEQVIVNRLAELEDKIENGTLIELPCKVGDIIYQIVTWVDKKGNKNTKIKTVQVYGYRINNNGIFIRTSISTVDINNFNKTLFETKAEAEERLKELQNENTSKQ